MKLFGFPHLAAFLLLIISWTGLSSPRVAADPQAMPTGGTILYAASQFPSVTLSGSNASLAVLASTDPRLHHVISVQTRVKPTNLWDIQVTALTTSPVMKGDIVLATFWGRVTDSMTGGGHIQFVFEQAASPFTKSSNFPASLTSTWTQFSIPFVVKEDYPAGQAAIHFQLGTYPQTVEIADLEIRNYGKNAKLSDLPQTSLTYKGRALDAPWRAAALARIENFRKADLTVTAVDKSGRAVPNATVSVRMQRQAFRFGSAIRSQILAGTEASPEDEHKYAEMFPKLFNSATMEAEMKWYLWDANGKSQADNLIPWLEKNQIRLRGHNLLWGAWHYIPAKDKALETDPKALRAAIDGHITEEAKYYHGKVDEWDVVNEPIDHTVLTDILGNQEMIRWYQLAHDADPNSRLVINDVSILTGNGEDTVHRTAYDKLLTYLLANGAPVQELGIECHFDQHVTDPQNLLNIVEDLSHKYHLPIEATEYDLGTNDEKLQGDYMRDFLTAMYSEPAVNGVTIWGFWEGAHWRPDASLFRKDWSVKPNGQVWFDLVRHQWWTNADGITNSDGRYNTRGFYGDYQVTVTQSGRSITVPYTLVKSGPPLVVTVK